MKVTSFVIGSILLPLVTTTPVLKVDIRISEDTDANNGPVGPFSFLFFSFLFFSFQINLKLIK
jgi:hypothetical protein